MVAASFQIPVYFTFDGEAVQAFLGDLANVLSVGGDAFRLGR